MAKIYRQTLIHTKNVEFAFCSTSWGLRITTILKQQPKSTPYVSCTYFTLIKNEINVHLYTPMNIQCCMLCEWFLKVAKFQDCRTSIQLNALMYLCLSRYCGLSKSGFRPRVQDNVPHPLPTPSRRGLVARIYGRRTTIISLWRCKGTTIIWIMQEIG